MKKYGFYIFAYGKPCFMESNANIRTKALALDFINKIQNKLNRFTLVDEKVIAYVQKQMQHATMELRTIENGNFKGLQYIAIDGENFSSGCDACENPFEKCVIV